MDEQEYIVCAADIRATNVKATSPKEAAKRALAQESWRSTARPPQHLEDIVSVNLVSELAQDEVEGPEEELRITRLNTVAKRIAMSSVNQLQRRASELGITFTGVESITALIDVLCTFRAKVMLATPVDFNGTDDELH